MYSSQWKLVRNVNPLLPLMHLRITFGELGSNSITQKRWVFFLRFYVHFLGLGQGIRLGHQSSMPFWCDLTCAEPGLDGGMPMHGGGDLKEEAF